MSFAQQKAAHSPYSNRFSRKPPFSLHSEFVLFLTWILLVVEDKLTVGMFSTLLPWRSTMISLLLGLYASEPIPTPARSCFPSFSKVALVASIALTYLTTSAFAQEGNNSAAECCSKFYPESTCTRYDNCASTNYAYCNSWDATIGMCARINSVKCPGCFK